VVNHPELLILVAGGIACEQQVRGWCFLVGGAQVKFCEVGRPFHRKQTGETHARVVRVGP
jgi:hypothetical protein